MKRAIPFALWSAFVVIVLVRGEARLYVADSYDWKLIASAATLALLALAAIVRRAGGTTPTRWPELLAHATPIVLLLVAAGELPAPPPMVASFGSTPRGASHAPRPFTGLPGNRVPVVVDGYRRAGVAELAWFDRDKRGDAVEVVGIYRSRGPAVADAELGAMPAHLLTRHVVTCCAADAQAVAVVLDFAGRTPPADGTWLRVRGTIGTPAQVDSWQACQVRVEESHAIDAPSDPYDWLTTSY